MEKGELRSHRGWGGFPSSRPPLPSSGSYGRKPRDTEVSSNDTPIILSKVRKSIRVDLRVDSPRTHPRRRTPPSWHPKHTGSDLWGLLATTVN